MAVERVLSNLNLISFKTEGGLQNHIDELQDGDLVFTPDNSLKGNLFDFKWTDHKLNDISWLNADTFSWQSGDVYEAAYNHLAEDCKVYAWQYAPTQGGDIGYTTTETPAVGGVLMIGSNACDITEVGSDYVVAEHYKTGEARTYQRVVGSDSTAFVAGVLSTETVSDVTISFYRAEDGHKIVGADQEANVQAIYEATGIAWYYILDRENKRFKLPRTKFGFTGLRDEVGKYVEAGLPNITGQFGYYLANVGSLGVNTATGAFSGTAKQSLPTATKTGTETATQNTLINFNANYSSSVYGNSNTVQPKATQMYLYFYVGNFERGAVEQTAGITSEMFNNKADVSRVQELENNKLDKSAEIYLVPTGSVTAFAGTSAPTGWLKCDGSAISRTTYSELFNVIGTTYGAGDGSTTFNLPTQSVLPLGTSATVKLTRPPTNKTQILRLQNDGYSYTWNKASQYSMGLFSESGDGVMKQETSDGTYPVALLDPNGTMYADIASATGAKAIACIKY